MHLDDDFVFKVGELETYAYVFQNAQKDFQTEYIHCVLLQILDEKTGVRPERILVNQIHNLEDYLLSPDSYDHFTKRILSTDNITELIGTKI